MHPHQLRRRQAAAAARLRLRRLLRRRRRGWAGAQRVEPEAVAAVGGGGGGGLRGGAVAPVGGGEEVRVREQERRGLPRRCGRITRCRAGGVSPPPPPPPRRYLFDASMLCRVLMWRQQAQRRCGVGDGVFCITAARRSALACACTAITPPSSWSNTTSTSGAAFGSTQVDECSHAP